MQINNICLFFNIEKSVMAERISANARNADWFFFVSLIAAGILATDDIYGLLYNDVRDRWSCCFDPVNNASFLYNGREAFSGSGTPDRCSPVESIDVRLDDDNVRTREFLVGTVKDELPDTSKVSTLIKLFVWTASSLADNND